MWYPQNQFSFEWVYIPYLSLQLYLGLSPATLSLNDLILHYIRDETQIHQPARIR